MSSEIMYLAAGDGEETFWIQLLVMVILATGIGIFGIIKKHKIARHSKNVVSVRYNSATRLLSKMLNGLARRKSELRQALLPAIGRTRTKLVMIFNFVSSKVTGRDDLSEAKSGTARPDSPVKREKRDFNAGMELLTREFLVEVVERTGTVEMQDVTMRNLCFTELVRRDELWAVSSDALKTYTLDREGAFNKSVRYQAMKELAGRTPVLRLADEAAADKNA